MKPVFRFFHRAFTGIPVAIWWLSLSQLVNRIGTMVIPFMTLYLTQKLGFPIEKAGFVMVCFGIGAILGSLLGGQLADRIGYRPVMIGSLAANGAGFLCLLPLTSFWAISAGVFLLALVAEGFRPASSMSIARFSSSETRTRSFSLYRLSLNLGWAAASAFGGLLASFDYSLIFWVDGFTCLASALFLFLLFKKIPESEEAAAETSAAAENGPAAAADRPAWRDGPYLAFTALTWLGAMVFMQCVWTVPPFFKMGLGFGEAAVGLLMGLNGLIVFAFEMPIIFTIEGKRPPLRLIRLGLVLYSLSYLALVLPLGPLAVAVASVALISFGEILVMPFSTTFATRRAPAARQGQYLALYTTAYSLSNVLAPLFGTQVAARFGWNALWFSLAVGAAVCCAGFLFLEKKLAPQPVLPVAEAELEPVEAGI